MKQSSTRAFKLTAFVGIIALSLFMILKGLEESVMFFHAPADVVAKQIEVAHPFRLGGMVVNGSLHKDKTTVTFDVTDFEETVRVQYTGILPDLFREGQGVVMDGKLNADHIFVADTVLAKHDESYMPPEVAKSLKNNPEEAAS